MLREVIRWLWAFAKAHPVISFIILVIIFFISAHYIDPFGDNLE